MGMFSENKFATTKSIAFVSAVFVAAIFFASSVLADPQVQVSSTVSPTPIAPGTDGYVQLTFTNIGTSSASSIQIVGVTADPQLNVSYNPAANLGSLGTSQTTNAVVRFSVSPSAPSGLYSMRFQIDYCTSTCNEVDPTAIVTVQSSSSLEVISIQPDILAAGQTATLNFNLANEGGDSINNIVMSWQTPNNEILPLGSSNREFIPSLGGGASLVLPINVSVGSSVSPGVYPLSIQLSYFDKSGVKQNFTSSIGMEVGGATDFDVGLQQYSSGTLSLSVANIGVNPATSVLVSIPQQSGYAVSGATSTFLGNLNAGDFSVANFAITPRISGTTATRTPGQGAAGTGFAGNSTGMLLVDITYTDTTGGRQNVEKQVSVNLGSALSGAATFQRSRGIGLTTIVIIVAVVAVAAAGVAYWYFKIRKKRKLKPS